MAPAKASDQHCAICSAPFPTRKDGSPRYWTTFYVDAQTRIPRSVRICFDCKEAQRHPIDQNLQPSLL